MNLCALSLGSNLGDRLENLLTARDRLRTLASPGHPFLQAPVYQSKPVDCPPDSPDFLNTAIAFHCSGSPHELFSATQKIESELGRPADHGHHTPRPIDIDILVFGTTTITSPDLSIPHPRLTARRFVLQPLADILPDLALPGDPLTIRQHLDLLPGPLTTFAAAW